jgi:hypothetical protein
MHQSQVAFVFFAVLSIVPVKAQELSPTLNNYTNALDGTRFTKIPDGAFTKNGSLIHLKSFNMATADVSVSQFKHFLISTNYKIDWVLSEHAADRTAAVNLSWDDAIAYCRWANVRPLSWAEWDYVVQLRSLPATGWQWVYDWQSDSSENFCEFSHVRWFAFPKWFNQEHYALLYSKPDTQSQSISLPLVSKTRPIQGHFRCVALGD